jgi:catechol 2,3-dioxygenase-like lactoylglutathione lyase family enzyme
MITYNGVNHVAMITGDMDSTIRYWRDLLGMRLVAGVGRPGYRHYFLEISERDLIAFFEWEGAEPAVEKDHGAPLSGKVIFDHISFGVENLDDLWELKSILETAGFWVSEVVDHGFIYSIYSFDPNNIPVEFSYTLPDKDIRKNPVMADKQPCPTALEGAEPQPGKWPEALKKIPGIDRRIYPGAGSELFHGTK